MTRRVVVWDLTTQRPYRGPISLVEVIGDPREEFERSGPRMPRTKLELDEDGSADFLVPPSGFRFATEPQAIQVDPSVPVWSAAQAVPDVVRLNVLPVSQVTYNSPWSGEHWIEDEHGVHLEPMELREPPDWRAQIGRTTSHVDACFDAEGAHWLVFVTYEGTGEQVDRRSIELTRGQSIFVPPPD